jgi:hypothetical protein
LRYIVIITICLLLPLSVFAKIDERKIDIYFANGINTKLNGIRGAIYNTTEVLEPAIRQEFYHNDEEMKKSIGKITYAYNQTSGPVLDIWESIAQKLNFQALIDALFDTKHGPDLQGQIDKYSQSILDGHRVLVVAHSQGNLFTGEAYTALEGWMKDYFFAVSVASPRLFKIKSNTPHIAFANDIVPYLGGVFIPIGNPNGEVGSIESHAFTYYMGYPSEKSHVSTNVAKIKIMKAISGGYTTLNQVMSQWNPTKPCSEISLVTHIEESSGLEDIPDVKIISAKGKLFEVDGQYVKADSDYIPDENGSEETVTIPTAHSGLITVGLSWLNNAHDLDLSFGAGVKDISSSEGVLAEHYYVQSEDDISPGTYGISVTGGVAPWADEACTNVKNSKDTVGISIGSPGGGAFFTVDTRSIGELNIGNVADLIVCEMGDTMCPDRTKIVKTVGDSILEVCNGDCSGIFEDRTPSLTYLYELELKHSQALNGPIAGAEINVYKANEYIDDTRKLLFTGATTTGTSIYTAGLINFPAELSDTLEDNEAYIIEIVGGSDIDLDDNKQIDVTPTINHGTMHALLSGKEIKNKGFKINILTEIAYQVSKGNLRDADDETLIFKLNDVASRLLKEDVNGDDIVDKDDLLKWIPSSDQDKMSVDFKTEVFPIITKLYRNEDIYLDVYKLLYADKIEVESTGVANNIYISLNSYADLSQLQKEDFVLKDSSGNSVDFTFTIIDGKVVIDPLNDLVDGQSYTLSFDLKIYDSQDNLYVDTQRHTFTIPDITPPVIQESTIHFNENYGGDLSFNASDPSTPLTFSIAGGTDSALFEIKNAYVGYDMYAGRIYFKEIPNYERPADSNGDNIYELDISVADSFANTTMQSIRIIVDDVTEGPLLADTNMTVNENMPIGTYVGTMTVVNEGDGNLTEFSLSDDNFRIDSEGKIYTRVAFDYERISEFKLGIRAKNNVDAWAATRYAFVSITNIPEPLPEVHALTGSMDDHAPQGKVVGQLYIYPGLDEAVEVRLTGEGAEDFDVNASGHITVSAIADLNHEVQKQYNLKAIASNSYGASGEANVTIYLNMWSKQMGSGDYDRVEVTATDNLNNVYFAGKVDNKIRVTIYDTFGTLVWAKDLNQTQNMGIRSMVVDENGTIYLAGSKNTGRTYTLYGATNHRYAASVLALSSNGDVLWSKDFDVDAARYDEFSKILLGDDGGLYLSGKTYGSFPGYANQGNYDLILARLTTLGTTDYVYQTGTSAYEYIIDMTFNQSNELYILTNQSNATVHQINLSDGHILFSKSLSAPSQNSYYTFKGFDFDAENNLYALVQDYIWWETRVGDQYSYGENANIVVLKMDRDFNEVWSRSYGSPAREFPKDIQINSNNEVYVMGETEGSLYSNVSKKPYMADYDDDFFLIKVDATGQMLQAKQFGTIGYDYVNAMIIDKNNDIYLGGGVARSLDGNFDFDGSDAFLMKVPY